MAKTISVPVGPMVEAAFQAMLAALRPYADALGPAGMLAVTANLVGKLIAMQDQRIMTPAMAMEIVASNIEAANQDVISRLAKSHGGRA
ncbi:MAG: hypothetical protein KGL35_11900 [Bradyrhizobium sp.]|nr:hypothetical protein [Bradyrhizobium sp.]